MNAVREIKLTDVYGGKHAYLSASPAFGGLVDFIVPDDTPNWTDYRAVGDTTDGCALTTTTFGRGIQYGVYVDGARASGYGLDKSLSVLHFTCHDTYGEHTLRRWAATNGMVGATPLETIDLVHTYDPLTNGQEHLAWIATDSFLMTALQWDAATQRIMHVIERFTGGVSAWNTVEAQRETYDPMLPPNKITSTYLSSLREYTFVLRGRYGYKPYDGTAHEETPTEFLLQVSSDSTFLDNVESYLIPADEEFVDSGSAHEGYADAPYTTYWNLQNPDNAFYRMICIQYADCSWLSTGELENLLGMCLYITAGTGTGYSGIVAHMHALPGSIARLTVVPDIGVQLDASTVWELRYKQGTKNIVIPATGNWYYRVLQRHDQDAWSSGLNIEGGTLVLSSWGEERDAAKWNDNASYLYTRHVCYDSHTYAGIAASAWRIKVNDRDFAATDWRIQGSVSADFTDDPIPIDETGSFVNYLRGCAVIRADTILDLAVPAAGWYVRARGENDDGSIVSEWSEDVYAKAGQADQSHSYTLYVPSYVGEREPHLCNDLVVTSTSGYALFIRYVNSVLNQAETEKEETLFLLPVSFAGVLGAPVTIVTYAGYLNYQPSIYRSGDIIYVAYYVDATHLYWKSYNTATATLSVEHTVVLPTGYTELGYGTIWRAGGLLFTAVFDYGPPSIAHLAYVDTAVSDTLQVLTNTHADDGGMQGSSGFGFWYPFVTDYDAHEDYGVAFLSTGQLKSFPWVGRFQLSKA
jgi:hypothetical protein